jgi:hypothetical protein
LIKISLAENKIFIATDIILHTKTSWQSEQVITTIAFYAATMIFLDTILKSLSNNEITLQEAIKKIQK